MDSDEDFENSSSSSDDFDELEHDISKQSPNTVPKLSNVRVGIMRILHNFPF